MSYDTLMFFKLIKFIIKIFISVVLLVSAYIGTEKIVRPYAYNQHDLNRLKLIHLEMANKGFLFAQRGYMTLNIAMVEKDTNEFLSAFEEVVTSHKEIFLM